MRRVLGSAMALVVGLAGTCLAGAMYRNDSGAVARAVRIEFSEPAEITSMWPNFPQRAPQGPATVIVLSGGEVPAGGWFSFTWRPDSARVVKVEWLAQSMLSACTPPGGDWSAQTAPRTGLENPLDMRFCGAHIGGNYATNTLNVAILPDAFFLYLRELHVNWVGVNIFLTVDDSMDSSVKASGRTPGYRCGFSDEELTRLIRKLRDYGFGVYLHVLLDWQREVPPGKRVRNWTIGDPYAYEYDPEVSREYWPWDPKHPMHDEFVAEFFATYTAHLVHYARIAEQEGAELLALGTEMDVLFRTRSGGSRWPTEFSAELRSMVDAVRAVYNGMLTYEVNHHRLIHTPTIPGFQCVWGDLGLDVVGISAYFPLLQSYEDRVPTVEELGVQWVRVFDDILTPLAKMYPDKPLVFAEFGYVDLPGSSVDPLSGEYTPRRPVDLDGNGLDDGEEEQANILDAFFRVAASYPFFRGIFVFGGYIASAAEWARGFGAHRGYDVRGELSEPVVRTWYQKWNPVLPELPPEKSSPTPGPLRAFAWESVPYAVVYPTQPQVGFHPDASASQHWGLDGSRVKGVKAVLLEDMFLVRLDLHEGDMIGHYGYVVGFRAGDKGLYVTIRPDEYRASVALGGQGFRELGLVFGDALEQSANSVAVAVKLSMFSDTFSVSTLAGSEVDMHIEYVYVGNGVWKRELFFMPGAGRVHIGQ